MKLSSTCELIDAMLTFCFQVQKTTQCLLCRAESLKECLIGNMEGRMIPWERRKVELNECQQILKYIHTN